MVCFLVIFVLFIVSQVSADCESDIQEYIQGLDPTQPQLWSLEMLDSSVKYPQDGIYEASYFIQMGNYDQCLAVRGPNDELGAPRFKGQYCHFNYGYQSSGLDLLNDNLKHARALRKSLEQISHNGLFTLAENKEYPFTWAVCAPSTCGEEGVIKVANLNMAAFSNLLGVRANTSLQPDSCYFEGSRPLDANTICFITFSIIVALWIAFSTAYESFNTNFEIKGWRILVKSFSLQTNFGDLFKLPTKPAPGQLGCLNGIRAMTMMWIILGHTYMFGTSLPATNFMTAQSKVGDNWILAPVMNGYTSVDTFLFLSGILVAYVPLVDHSKGRKFIVWKYYIYRYFRITPAVAVAIWYLTSLNFHLGHGPMWYFTAGINRTGCLENWWPTLLYITNYFYSFCLGQTWYLCVDMQLAFLAPIIIIPLIKWPKYGLGLIALLTCASLGAIFGVTYVNNYPWTFISKMGYDNGKNYMKDVYTNTPLRAVPYLVGMALGYFLSKKIKIEIPKWGVALGWILSTTTCLAIIYSIVIPFSDDYIYEPVAASFYASLHKLGWGIGLAWIVWACVNGYGGPVNKILAWKYFMPLSKISFAAFLIHSDLINFQRGLRRTSGFISNFEMLYLYSGFLVMCFPLSVLLYITIEAPAVNILRNVFSKAPRHAAAPKLAENKK